MKIRIFISRALRAIFYFVFSRSRFTIGTLFNYFSKKRIAMTNVSVSDIKFKMFVDLDDYGVSRQLLLLKQREYPNSSFVCDFIKENNKKISSIVDIGANIGYYTLLIDQVFKQKINKDINIYSIEPVPQSLSLLQSTILALDRKNIKCINTAIGGKDQEIVIAVPTRRNLSHIKGDVATIKMAMNHEEQNIRMTSLKTLFTENKIPTENILFRYDIEGYEYHLIVENKEFIKSLKNVFIIMEFHPFLLKKEEVYLFLNTLKELNFKLEKVVSCMPFYFIATPLIFRNLLLKLWHWDKQNDNLGYIPRIKTIDDLISEVGNTKSPIYTHPQLHLYLSKE